MEWVYTPIIRFTVLANQTSVKLAQERRYCGRCSWDVRPNLLIDQVLQVSSSTIIRHLIAEHGNKHIAYYFFDFKDPAKQDVKGLLASLLMQVTGGFGSLPKPLLELFRQHQSRNPERPTPPTTDELMGVLDGVLRLQMTTFVLIDALDECKQIDLLMETLCAILDQKASKCRFLFTSRAEIEIQSRLRKQDIKNLHIQNAAVDHDVAIYVRAILQTDDRLRAHRQGIKDLITITLTNGAKGMCVATVCYQWRSLTHIGFAGSNAKLTALEDSEPPMRLSKL